MIEELSFSDLPQSQKGPLHYDPDTVKTGSLVCFSLVSCQQRLVVMCDCHGRLEVKELWRQSVWDAQAFPCHCLLFYLWLKVTEYLPSPSPRYFIKKYCSATFCLVLWCCLRLCFSHSFCNANWKVLFCSLFVYNVFWGYTETFCRLAIIDTLKY